MKKNYIRQEDYDFYSIKLPLKIVLSQRRKKFILHELEKIHPKVSASCFIKSWLRLKKWNFQADVAVMEKTLLARYKNEFPGRFLYLPEKKRNPIAFGKKKISLALSVFLLLFAGFFCGRIILKVFGTQKTAENKSGLNAKNEISAEAAVPVLIAPSKMIASVFSSVSKNGGRISSFSFNRGICVFSVAGCSSEEIAQAQYCVVSYKDNKPHFTLSVPVLEDEMKIFPVKDFERILQVDYQDSVKKVRNELFLLGTSIQKEHISEKEAEFEFSVPEDFFYSALKICGTEAQNLGWKEKSFSVEKSGNQNHVKVIFSRKNEGKFYSENADFADSDFSPMLLTASYAWLFKSESSEFEKSKKSDESIKLVQKSNPFKKTLRPKEVELRTKIGEIRKKDGALYIFYRNESGKIICEKSVS